MVNTTKMLWTLIAAFDAAGNLPAGIHCATWQEVQTRFGTNEHRKGLLVGLERALALLQQAGCMTVYIDGSFVTSKLLPNDYDCCWEPAGVNSKILDGTFLDFTPAGRLRQKAKFGGEFFPSSTVENHSQKPFLDFFQIDKETGQPKGIVAIDMRGSL